MILSDLASPAQAACKGGKDQELTGFAEAENRFPSPDQTSEDKLFGIMLYSQISTFGSDASTCRSNV